MHSVYSVVYINTKITYLLYYVYYIGYIFAFISG